MDMLYLFQVSVPVLSILKINPVHLCWCDNFCQYYNSKDGEVFVFKDNQYDITPYPIYNAIADTYRFAFTSWTF